MKDWDMPNYIPKRTGKTPLFQPSELYKLKCPRCNKKSSLGSDYPRFSEWLHFLWCDKCEAQYPTILWIYPLSSQEKIFLKIYVRPL